MKALFSAVNVRAGYLILFLVVPFYLLFARKGYRAIYRYFRRQHGYPAMKAFFATCRNHYLFGQMMLDRFAVYAGQRVFTLDNPDNDLFLRMVYSRQGCIIAHSHVGNPELCGYLLSQHTKRINSLIFGGEAEEVQKNRSAMFAGNNVRLIPTSDDLSHVFLIHEALTNGEMLSIPCDRAFGSSKTVECDFLNGTTRFPTGAFVLAVQFNVPVIALFVVKIAATRYRIHVRQVSVPIEEAGSRRQQIDGMTRAFVKILEDIVKKYPEQWFNFYNFWKDETVSRP